MTFSAFPLERLRRFVMQHGAFSGAAAVFCRRTRAEYQALRRLESSSAEDLRATQAARLARLIRWAYDTVPYYRRIMDATGIGPRDIANPHDLARLPVLTKRTVQTSAAALVSAAADPRDIERRPTAGTTGTPLVCYRDRRVASFGRAVWWQTLVWAGASPADPLVTTEPVLDLPARRRPTWRETLTGDRLIPFSAIVGCDLNTLLPFLTQAHGGVLCLLPSSLHLISRALLQAGLEGRFRPRALFYHGEVMPDDTRSLVAQAFGVPILSRYGAHEFAAMVAQTCQHGRLHINSEGFVVEIVDGNPGDSLGSPVARGRILITDLRNYVMPLIRYEIGDLGSAAVDRGCPCGRRFPLLDEVSGRAVEFVITRANRLIPVTAFQRLLNHQSRYMWEYQLQQEAVGELRLTVVPRPDFSGGYAAGLAGTLERFLGGEMTVRVTPVTHIPRDISGKRPLLKTTLVSTTI